MLAKHTSFPAAKERGQGLGLAKKGGKHVEPHTKPEVRKLLQKYQDEELHLFRPGRHYDVADVDDFSRGYKKLQEGALQKWIAETTRTRGLMQELEHLIETSNNKDEEGSPDNEENEVELTPGRCYMDNGELVIETDDLEDQEQSNEDDDAAMETDGLEDEDDGADDEFAEVEFDEEYDDSGGDDGGDI